MNRQVASQEGFFSDALLRCLTDIYIRNATAASGRDYSGNPVLYLADLKRHEPEYSSALQAAESCLAWARATLNADMPLYLETVLLTGLAHGGCHPPPADNAALGADGIWLPNHTPARHVSAIAYLNSGFSGGELVFPELSIEIRPTPGLLVAFPSDAGFVHLVRPVDGAIRYSMALWFTFEEANQMALT